MSAEEFALMSEGGRCHRRNDIIYSRNASVGSAAQVHDDREICLGQDLCLVRSTGISQAFLEQFLNSTACLIQLGSYLIGATFKRVNVDVIKKYVVPLPPNDEQDTIATFILTEISRISSSERKISGSI